MKLSERTLQLLRNFTNINPSIIFPKGNVVRVMSESRSILAKTVIAEDIPETFAIFDMTRLLGALSMFREPEINVTKSFLQITEGGEHIDFVCTDPLLLRAPPEKEVTLKTVDVTFNLTADNIQRILKGMAITGANALCITGENGKLYLQARTVSSNKNHPNISSAPSYSMDIGSVSRDFQFILMADNIKMIPDNYVVNISSQGLAHFKGSDVEYFIAVESNSTY